MFDTTASKLRTMSALLIEAERRNLASKWLYGATLYDARQPYSACTTEAERDGWTAAFSEVIDAQREHTLEVA